MRAAHAMRDDVPGESMQVVVRSTPGEVEASIRDRIRCDVDDALNSILTVRDEFVVNDTPWYGLSRGKVRRRVVNAAGFISQKFTRFLEGSRGWNRHKSIEEQEIDAYIELPTSPGFTLKEGVLYRFIEEFIVDHPMEKPDKIMLLYYNMYNERTCFQIGEMEKKYLRYFRRAKQTGPIRIGLEFETGNIASSFRALNKLGFLYRRGLIDAGVFITSRNKESATRIWPATNRNGSFEELERLQYRDAVFLPLWEFGFAPDRFDRDAPYLGVNGAYKLTDCHRSKQVNGITYEVWKKNKMELLRLTQPST